MADDTDDSFLREIEEELRQENLKKLWDKYGLFVVILVVAIVFGVAGFKGWQYWDHRSRMKQGAEFAAAAQLARDGKTDAARKAFATLAKNGDAGYAMLARFRDASLLGKAGKSTEAAAAFEALANDNSIPSRYRSVARLLGGIYALDGGADGQKVADQLAPLRDDTNPYRFSAREISALALAKAGKTDEARKMLKTLVDEPRAPRGVVVRARELLKTLGG